MKPEADDYLEKAFSAFADANQVLDLPRVAAREAYRAAYYAAEAYIFEQTDKTVKAHRELMKVLADLWKNDVKARERLTLLAQAYELKSLADYDGSGPHAITVQEAASITGMTRQFINDVAQLLTPGQKAASVNPTPLSTYEAARVRVEALYEHLPLKDRARASRGTVWGFLTSAILGLMLHSFGFPSLATFTNLGRTGVNLITTALAQTNGSSSVNSLPPFIVSGIYIVLLLLLATSFYLATIKRRQDAVSRDAWKTLLGFFIGLLSRR